MQTSQLEKQLFSRYQHMKERCNNPNNKSFHRYGGRGIKVCQEWMDDFQCFKKWALENGYKKELAIDRIDNDGDYCPENCRFVTLAENNQNRSTTKFFTYNGKTQNLMQWCKEFNLPYGRILARIRRGWDFDKSITTPVRERKRDKNEIIGKRFGRLTVLRYAGDEYIGSDKNSRYICLCDCGKETIVGEGKLKSGHKKSCGCLQREIMKHKQLNNNTHKKSKTLPH